MRLHLLLAGSALALAMNVTSALAQGAPATPTDAPQQQQPAPAAPAPAASLPDIQSFTLANGLEVIVVANHRVPAVSHMIWYRVGAADDPPGKSGLAHFHEHLMFKGTRKFKAGEYADIIARNGGEQNAFTGYDATSYFVNIDKKHLGLVMELEADRMRGLMPGNDETTREKEVIIEERRARIENNPDALLAEQMNAALYRHHPYHTPVIGWMHEMQRLSKDDVLAFHNRYYHPNNAYLVISGDITAQEAKSLAQRYYGDLPRAKIPERKWNDEPPQNAQRWLELRHANVKQPSWSRVYMAPSLGYGRKEMALPLMVLAQLLSGKTGLFYQRLVVEQKLASSIDVDYHPFVIGPGEFSLALVPEANIDMQTLEKAVDKEIAALLKDGFPEENFTRAKTQLKAESIYARDGLTSMARIMGWVRMVGLGTDYFAHWPDLIGAVSKEQVMAGAREVFKPEQSVTAALLPAPAGEPQKAAP